MQDIENKKHRINRTVFPIQSKPHFKVLEPNLSLGYLAKDQGSVWQVRFKGPTGLYSVRNIGFCDDGAKKPSIANLDQFIRSANGGDHLAKMLKHEVLSYAQAVVVALYIGGNPMPTRKASRFSVAACVEGYQQYRTALGKSPLAIKKDAYVFKAHVIAKLGNIPLAELTREMLDAWFAQLPGSNANANRIRASFIAVLNWAADNGKLIHRPWHGLARKTVSAKDEFVEDRFLDASQINAWIKACENSQTAALLKMAACSGFRLGEIRNLKLADVSLGNSKIRVTGKTGTRTVALASNVANLLKPMLVGKKRQDYVFNHPDGGIWRPNSHKRFVERAAIKAGLFGYTIYDLRHTWITAMLKGGVDVLTVSQVAGTSIAMIQKNYAELAISKTKQALDKVNIKIK